MSEPSIGVDLSTFSKIRPYSVDDLRRYSAADLDPHTIQVGQILCQNLSFSPKGQRNLSSAFESLPQNTLGQDDFEIGFGSHHIIHSILKTDDGFNLAALVGALGEYFHEDVIVDFFSVLAKTSGLPVAWQPLEHQWRRMVGVLCGVLATSSLGMLLSSIEDAYPAAATGADGLDVGRLVDALLQVNGSTQKSAGAVRLTLGEEFVWVVAVAQWLFELKVAVSFPGSESAQPQQDAAVIIDFAKSADQASFKKLSISDSATSPSLLLGGRVSFEHLFRSCFGEAFTRIGDDNLAALICCASTIVRHRLDQLQPDWADRILSQVSASSGTTSSSFLDTLTAWFPELRRLSPRFRKYVSLDYEAAKATFDATYDGIRAHCPCPDCVDSRPMDKEDPSKCSRKIATFIISLSIALNRMFISPKLLPKRQGVLRLQRNWASEDVQKRIGQKSASSAPSETYLTIVGEYFTMTSGMLKAAAVLFANFSSPEIDQIDDLMGTTLFGLAIFATGAKDYKEAGIDSASVKRWKSAVHVSPGWMCLFGHEARLEIYEKLFDGPEFRELDALMKKEGELDKTRQVLKWRGRTMITSIVYRGDEEKKAYQDGWVGIG